MRSYDPNDESDQKDAERLRAEPWMLDLLSVNPEYPHWGPYEDYMSGSEKDGWRAPIIHNTWKECDIHLDTLNEIVNFYFYVSRDTKECSLCEGSGFSQYARALRDDFYGYNGEARRWRDKITLEDAQALVSNRRCLDWDPAANEWVVPVVDEAFVARINAQNSPGARCLGHDTINLHVMIEGRCERAGKPYMCECGGDGRVFTADHAQVGVVFWLIHPRKGASRGVDIKLVEREEVPSVMEFLATAAQRNADRFAKVVSRIR